MARRDGHMTVRVWVGLHGHVSRLEYPSPRRMPRRHATALHRSNGGEPRGEPGGAPGMHIVSGGTRPLLQWSGAVGQARATGYWDAHCPCTWPVCPLHHVRQWLLQLGLGWWMQTDEEGCMSRCPQRVAIACDRLGRLGKTPNRVGSGLIHTPSRCHGTKGVRRHHRSTARC